MIFFLAEKSKAASWYSILGTSHVFAFNPLFLPRRTCGSQIIPPSLYPVKQHYHAYHILEPSPGDRGGGNKVILTVFLHGGKGKIGTAWVHNHH